MKMFRATILLTTAVLLLPLFFCILVEATCSSPIGNGTILTASSGTIQSVPGGVENAGYSSSTDTCIWTIQCPSNYSVGMTEIKGWLPNGDTLNFYRASNMGAYPLPLGTYFDGNYMFGSVSTIMITYAASGYGKRGFTLVYACFPTSCTSVNGSDVVFSQSSGSIFSDGDGAGSQNYLYKESCQWTIQCPLNQYVIINPVEGITYSSDTIKFYEGHGTKLISTTFGAHLRGTISLSDRMRINFYPISTFSGSSRSGFEIHWRCSSQPCSSVNATENILTQRDGRIISDGDGRLSTIRYLRNENCTWEIQCPHPNLNVALIEFRGTTASSSDVVTLYNQNATFLSSSSYYFDDSQYTYTNLLSVSFRSLDSHNSGSDYGFTLVYECSTERCSSPNATGSIFTESTGWLLSDPDGPLSAYRYLGGEDCQWVIQCPPNQKVGFPEVYGSTYNNYDALRFYKGNSKATTLDTLSGITLYNELSIFDVDAVTITFVTNKQDTTTGWSLRWKCYPSMCSSSTDGEIFSSRAGIIQTDVDGKGAAYYYLNREKCVWYIRCPLNDSILQVWVEGDSITSSDQLLLNTSIQKISISGFRLGSSQKGYLFPSRALDVRFATNAYNTDEGFTLRYSCVNSMCSSVNETGSVFNTSEGTIISDVDGASSVNFLQNETCVWFIVCPMMSDRVIQIKQLKTKIYSGTSIVLSNTATGEVLRTTSTSKTESFFLAATQATVDFSSSARGSTYDGFTLQWSCKSSRCSSVNRSNVLYSGSGVIISDTNGASSRDYYEGGEDCQWNIQCHSASDGIYYSVKGRIVPGDQVSVYYGAGMKKDFVSQSSSSSVYISKDEYLSSVSHLVLKFQSSLDSVGSYGFTFFYTCQPTLCSSPTRSGSTLAAPSGVILSDVDGASSQTYYSANENCVWYIQCPLRNSSLFLSWSGYLYNSNDALKILNPYSEQVLYSWYGSTPKFQALHYSRVKIQWSTSTSTQRYGFTLLYGCSGSRKCHSPTNQSVYRQASGTILSDQDGSGKAVQYVAFQQCNWRVACPSPTQFLKFSVIGNLAFGDSLSFYTATQYAKLTSSGMSSSHSTDSLWKSSKVNISFSPASSYYGFTMKWTCVTSLCTATRPSGSLSAGPVITYLKSDSSGASSSVLYPSGQSCYWNINCGVNKSVTITIYGRTPNSFDVFKVLAPQEQNKLLSSYYGSFTTSRTVASLRSIVQMTWNSSLNNYGSSSRYGWTVSYRCVHSFIPPPIPNSICTASQDGNILSKSTGTVGFAPGASYGNYEDCRWAITCPNPQSFLLLYVRVDTASSADYLQIFNTQTGSSVGMYSACCTARYVLPGTSSIFVRFVSNYMYATSNGAQVEWICLSSDTTTPSTLTTISVGSSGSFSSDPSGYDSNSVYQNNLNTLTVLACSGGKQVRITRVEGQTYNSNDVLTIYKRSDGVQMLRTYYTFNRAVSWQDTAFIVHFVTDAQYSGRGFNIEYLCTTSSSSTTNSLAVSLSSSRRVSLIIVIVASVIGFGVIVFLLIFFCNRKSKKEKERRERMAVYQAAETAEEPQHSEEATQSESTVPPPGHPPPQSQGSPAPPPGQWGTWQGSPPLQSQGPPGQWVSPPGPLGQWGTWQGSPPPLQYAVYPAAPVQGSFVQGLPYSPREAQDTNASFSGQQSSPRVESVPQPPPRSLLSSMHLHQTPSQSACAVCKAERPICALNPCGHIVLCSSCNGRFENQSCPICHDRCRSSIAVTFLPAPSVAEGIAEKNVPQSAAANLEDIELEIEMQPVLEDASCTLCHAKAAHFCPVPCGHVCLCDDCRPSRCPVCNGYCMDVIQIFR